MRNYTDAKRGTVIHHLKALKDFGKRFITCNKDLLLFNVVSEAK